MKKITIALSLLLTLTMLMSVTVSAAGFSAGVLDNPNYSLNLDGINYVEKTSTQTGYSQKIFYGEYNTTSSDAKYEWVIHSIKTSDTETTLSTVMAIAKDFESTTGRKVMLAVNGDFFYTTGANVDTYVNNGIVYSKGNMANKNCLGFDNEGKVVLGRMTETKDCVVLYDENGNPVLYPIAGYNTQPGAGEITVYNTAGTYTVSNAGAAVIRTEATNLTQYPLRAIDRTTTKIRDVQDSISFTLTSGQLAVVYSAECSDSFSTLKYGKAVDIVETPAGSYEGCTWVIGGYDKLVNNYVVNTDCHTDNSGSADRARTFMGFKEDGTGFVCVVDEIGGSYGINVNQEADLADALGAQYALELDGGGSSTMIVRVNDSLVCRNNPSDGSMRKVSNAVLLVEKAEEETPAHTCESKCDECGKCTDTACTEDSCADKCQGHQVEHTCDSLCGTCGKCLDTECTDSACAEKCQGHEAPNPGTPDDPEDDNPGDDNTGDDNPGTQQGSNQNNQSSGNGFLDWIMSFFEAIIDFFRNLFS